MIALEYLLDRPKPHDYQAGTPFAIAEHKLDGHRVTLLRGPDGDRMAIGRDVKIDLWPQLGASPRMQALMSAMPYGTIVDGELHVDGPATDVRRALASNVDALDYCAFAMPLMGRDDWRERSLQEVRTMLSGMGFTVPAALERGDSVGFDLATIEEWKARCRSMHLEGLVLKQAHWSGWYKLKPTSTIDVIVYGVLPGAGKHAGRMGALMIGAHDEGGVFRPMGKVGTGFSDAEREMGKAHWMNRVIEVEYDSIAAAGRLRFPTFVRERDDKPAAECRLPRRT